MKLLVMSDTHYYNEYFERVLLKYKNKVDYIVHCGDSSLTKDDPLIKQVDFVVKGNHDDEDFPPYIIFQDICITHGHYYNVYKGYDEFIQLCKEHHCHICFHGHTHVPTHQIHEGIHFINPGCLMMNRGSYGFGTYAYVEINDSSVQVKYLHHETDEDVSDIVLEEGLSLLEEFKKLV